MLFPERFNFNNNLFDDFFTDPVFNMTTTNRMSTDIKEKDNGYELAMEVPGFDKEDLKLDLEDGYLTVSAEHSKTLWQYKEKFLCRRCSNKRRHPS